MPSIYTDIRAAADAAVIASKIISELDKSVSIGGTEIHASASIGISVYPADGSDSDTLVAHADEAMYFAKQAGRNNFHFFSPGMSVFSRERLDLESGLRRALLPNEIGDFVQKNAEAASLPDQSKFLETQSKLMAYKRS